MHNRRLTGIALCLTLSFFGGCSAKEEPASPTPAVSATAVIKETPSPVTPSPSEEIEPTPYVITGTHTDSDLLIEGEDRLIPAILCQPDGGYDEIVILLHGYGADKNCGGIFSLAARLLADEYGLASIRIDFPGCGDSAESFSVFDFQSGVADVMAVVEYIKENIGAVDIDVAGHSMGGTIAMLSAGRNPTLFDTVVSWNGAVDLSVLYTTSQRDYAYEHGSYPKYISWLGKTIDISAQWFYDVENTDVLAVFAGFAGRVLACTGSDDTTVDPSCGSQVALAGANGESENIIYEGADHMFNWNRESDHHTVLQVINDTAEYLVSH